MLNSGKSTDPSHTGNVVAKQFSFLLLRPVSVTAVTVFSRYHDAQLSDKSSHRETRSMRG